MQSHKATKKKKIVDEYASRAHIKKRVGGRGRGRENIDKQTSLEHRNRDSEKRGGKGLVRRTSSTQRFVILSI